MRLSIDERFGGQEADHRNRIGGYRRGNETTKSRLEEKKRRGWQLVTDMFGIIVML